MPKPVPVLMKKQNKGIRGQWYGGLRRAKFFVGAFGAEAAGGSIGSFTLPPFYLYERRMRNKKWLAQIRNRSRRP